MEMRNERAHGLLKGRMGVLALIATFCLVIAGLFGASNAKAATVGGPVAVDFNYVGIDVTAAALGGISEIVLKPEDALGALELRGTYTSTGGDFTVPKVGGLSFPPLVLDVGGVQLTGAIALTANATGRYTEGTGAMTLNPKISLNLGVSDVSVLPIPGLGTGALGCEFAPLDVDLSTAGGWPAAGNTFDPGTFQNGAVSGAWTIKPDVVATQGLQSTCDLIGAILEPVGGLWLAQSTTPVASMPDATSAKPPEATCPENTTGTPPNCIDDPVEPGKVQVKGKPKGVTIKRGKTGTVKVSVRNTGAGPAGGVKVCGKISKKIGKVSCASLGTIAAGKSKTAKLKIKTSKKAKGKTKLKIKVSSKGAGSASSSAIVKIKR